MKKYDYAGREGLMQGNWKQHNLRKPLLLDERPTAGVLFYVLANCSQTAWICCSAMGSS